MKDLIQKQEDSGKIDCQVGKLETQLSWISSLEWRIITEEWYAKSILDHGE